MRNRQVGLALFTLLAIGLEMAGARCFRLSLRDLLQAVLGSAAESTKQTYLNGADFTHLLVFVVAVAMDRRRIFLVAGPPVAAMGMALTIFGSGQLVVLGLAFVALGTACWKAGWLAVLAEQFHEARIGVVVAGFALEHAVMNTGMLGGTTWLGILSAIGPRAYAGAGLVLTALAGVAAALTLAFEAERSALPPRVAQPWGLGVAVAAAVLLGLSNFASNDVGEVQFRAFSGLSPALMTSAYSANPFTVALVGTLLALALGIASARGFQVSPAVPLGVGLLVYVVSVVPLRGTLGLPVVFWSIEVGALAEVAVHAGALAAIAAASPPRAWPALFSVPSLTTLALGKLFPLAEGEVRSDVAFLGPTFALAAVGAALLVARERLALEPSPAAPTAPVTSG